LLPAELLLPFSFATSACSTWNIAKTAREEQHKGSTRCESSTSASTAVSTAARLQSLHLVQLSK
jgi:hypothetical protein